MYSKMQVSLVMLVLELEFTHTLGGGARVDTLWKIKGWFMHPGPKQGNEDEALILINGCLVESEVGNAVDGQSPDDRSKFPFFSMIIQNCHEPRVDVVSHKDPRYSSFWMANSSSFFGSPNCEGCWPNFKSFSTVVTSWSISHTLPACNKDERFFHMVSSFHKLRDSSPMALCVVSLRVYYSLVFYY